MNDKKNIEKLLSKLPEIDLPKGYDERFLAKLEQEENPARFWLKKLSDFSKPSGLRWAATLGSLLIVCTAILKSRKKNQDTDFAVNDEIDMMDDLDVLLEWNDEEENV